MTAEFTYFYDWPQMIDGYCGHLHLNEAEVEACLDAPFDAGAIQIRFVRPWIRRYLISELAVLPRCARNLDTWPCAKHRIDEAELNDRITRLNDQITLYIAHLHPKVHNLDLGLESTAALNKALRSFDEWMFRQSNILMAILELEEITIDDLLAFEQVLAREAVYSVQSTWSELMKIPDDTIDPMLSELRSKRLFDGDRRDPTWPFESKDAAGSGKPR